MESLNTYLYEVFSPLVVATIGGSVMGWEREVRDKPAGLRTHMLVSLAAAAFMVSTLQYISVEAQRELPFLRVDVAGVISGIVGGVGFLGAGTIIEARGKVQGITTAASIWVAAAIGVACGLRFFAVALTAILLTMTTLLLMGTLERLLFTQKSQDDSR